MTVDEPESPGASRRGPSRPERFEAIEALVQQLHGAVGPDRQKIADRVDLRDVPRIVPRIGPLPMEPDDRRQRLRVPGKSVGREIDRDARGQSPGRERAVGGLGPASPVVDRSHEKGVRSLESREPVPLYRHGRVVLIRGEHEDAVGADCLRPRIEPRRVLPVEPERVAVADDELVALDLSVAVLPQPTELHRISHDVLFDRPVHELDRRRGVRSRRADEHVIRAAPAEERRRGEENRNYSAPHAHTLHRMTTNFPTTRRNLPSSGSTLKRYTPLAMPCPFLDTMFHGSVPLPPVPS